MKITYIIFFCTSLSLLSCVPSSNLQDQVTHDDLEQSDTFLSGDNGANDSMGFTTLEVDQLENEGSPYQHSLIELMQTIATYKKQPLEGHAYLLAQVKNRSETLDPENDLIGKIEIQYLIYFDHLLFLPNLRDEYKATAYAENLTAIYAHTDPIEWRVLADLLSVGSTVLTSNEIVLYKERIITGIYETLDPGILTNRQHNDRLANDGRVVLEFIHKI